MTFDPFSGGVVLFGGSAASLSAETWVYDGSNWTLLAPATSPTARFGAQLVYDLARGVSVLYGGLASPISIPPPNNDTWEWNGTTMTWTQATPVANVLTNGNHARAAAEFRDRFSIPILAHAAAAAELGLPIDQLLAEGDTALGHLAVIEIAGAPPGEIALHGDGILCVGDALIHLEPMGFSLLPEKYCTDAREMRRALGKLLRFDFEVLTFAHGLPLVAQARRRLENLLA